MPSPLEPQSADRGQFQRRGGDVDADIETQQSVCVSGSGKPWVNQGKRASI
jgi:hypothetical protein